MAPRPSISIVWLKRDLRLRDHEAIAAALKDAHPVLFLFCYEPEQVRDDHYSPRHFRFIDDSIADLNRQLHIHQTSILAPYCEALKVFQLLHQQCNIKAVYSLQETGIAITYQRDKHVAAWLKQHSIPWHEYQCNGVQRGLRNRKRWVHDWHAYMAQPTHTFEPTNKAFVPAARVTEWAAALPSWEPEYAEPAANFQRGGEAEAWKTLQTFLHQRAGAYFKSISKPAASRTHCSRLSPYLAWGNLSTAGVSAGTAGPRSGKVSPAAGAIWLSAALALPFHSEV